MDLHFWLTLGVIASITLALVLELASVEVIFLCALLVLVVGGVVPVNDAFTGFSNHGMLAVAFLFIVAAAMDATGVLQKVGPAVLGTGKRSNRVTLSRLLFPIAGISAFLNNTPLVAMTIPVVKNWSKRTGIASSRFLLPISYAAVLGGTITLIGTSTNLVVHGLLLNHGLPGFGMFELARVGIPVTVVGLVFFIFVLSPLLPERKESVVELGERTREFVIGLKVTRDYPGIGSSVEAAGLRHLQGLFLFQIERNGKRVAPIDPAETILEHDRLFFTGVPSTIVELQRQRGLEVSESSQFDLKNYDSFEIKTYEVVVSESSPLIGRSVRESDFRASYDAVILAIHRSGERIERKIGDIILKAGDVLLVLANKKFRESWYHSRDFFLVSASDEVPSKPKQKMILTFVISIVMVVLVATEMVDMVIASLAAGMALIITRSIRRAEALQSIEWGTLVVIASSLAIAKGLESSGVAAVFAGFITKVSAGFGPLGVIAVLYFSTVLYTEFVTNNAAAALIFPIALSVAASTGMPVRPLIYAVTIGASCGFATPMGYQTNMMVFAAGGYRFKDMLKVGIPMDLVVGATAVGSIYLTFYS